MATTNPIHNDLYKNNRDLKERDDFDITDAIMYRKDDVGRFLLRLSIGGLMLIHGVNKLVYGNQGVEQILSSAGIPPFFSFGVFLGEVVGPVMVILGWKSRIGAFLIAINMLIAVLLVHAAQLTQVNEMGGWMVELNFLYLLGAIAIIFLGSGKYAVTKGRGVFD